MHCSIANCFRGIGLDRHHLVRVDAEWLCVSQDAPSDPRRLVRQRSRKLVVVKASRRLLMPGPEAEALPIMWAH